MQLDFRAADPQHPLLNPLPGRDLRQMAQMLRKSRRFFFSIIFLWRVQSVAPTARRQTGNVSMLRGPRAGQSPETADWGTSGKDGGEICRLQLLPPQPNVPWETGLHTQQCCGRENRKWGGGQGGTSPPPSSVPLAGVASRDILFHLISVGVPLKAPRCVQEHRGVLLFFFCFFAGLLLRACVTHHHHGV